MNIPSNIPSPDRKIGTTDSVFGEMVVVVYSYPKCVFACVDSVSVMRGRGKSLIHSYSISLLRGESGSCGFTAYN